MTKNVFARRIAVLLVFIILVLIVALLVDYNGIGTRAFIALGLLTETPTATATNTPTSTPTATNTPTTTNTPTATNTPTTTNTPTPTSTLTPTVTHSPTIKPPDQNSVVLTATALAILMQPDTATRTPTPNPISSSVMLDYGDTTSGMIDDDQPGVIYSFEANAGDEILIYMEATSGDLDPFLGLFDSENNLVMSNDDSSANDSNAEIIATIPDDGIYFIVATRYQFRDGTTSGSYELTIEDSQRTIAGNSSQSNTLNDGDYLEYGDSGTAEINDNQPFLQFVFEGRAGDVVEIMMEATSGDLEPLLGLFDSNGELLVTAGDGTDFARLTWTLAADEEYIIAATRIGVEDGVTSGEFRLSLVSLGVPEATEEATEEPGETLTPIASDTPCPYCDWTGTHVVQVGETFFQIAQRYGITLQQLAEANHLDNPNLIVAGATLRVPFDITPTAEATKEPDETLTPMANDTPCPYCDWTGTHVVQRGETMYQLSLRYGIPIQELLDANQLNDSSLIRVGITLRVPFDITPTAEATEEPGESPTPSITPEEISSVNLTETAQFVVVRDRSGLKVGEGVVRLFTPDTLALDNIGEIRVEIEVFQPNAQFVAIANLASLPTATPDIRIRPTSTPPPLTENYAITVYEYMGVDVTGLGLRHFNLNPIPPSGMQHFTEPDQMHTWQWEIEAKDRAALGESQLWIEVYLSDAEGNRYELATDPIPFSITVIEPEVVEAVAAGAAANAPEATSGDANGAGAPAASEETGNLIATPAASPSPLPTATSPVTATQPQRAVSVTAEETPAEDNTVLLIVIILVVVGAVGLGAILVFRHRHKPSAFISYRRVPSATLATLIAKELEKHGIQVFVDTRSVDGGGLFPRRLIEAIHNNDVFVCLVADTTFESDWVREEITQAHTIGKTMIPVFQESWEQLTPKPQAPNEHIKALLDSDGVHILDIRNVYVDEAIEELAKMVRVTARKA
ncbi:MAG: LysM peptidoglycan-binding domain-containing protein [Anaerolineaceae bacterium]|nr:LysM peptidoglycan-binding domain-containing protein [Anaerolineaceae bacterium]